MQTTAILSELLVIGTVSMSWIYPLSKDILNIQNLSIPFNSQGIALIVLLVIIYLIGLIINNVSDLLFHYFDVWIVNEYGGKELLQKKRIKIILNSEEGAKYLYKKRSFVRILRSSTFNTLAFTIYLVLNPVYQNNLFNVDFYLIFIFLTLLFFLFLYLYKRALKGYFIVVESLYGEL